MKVNLEHKVGAPAEDQGGAFGRRDGAGAGRPSAEASGGEESWGAEAAVAGAGVGGITLSGRAGGIGEKERVVNELPVRGPKLERLDVAVVGEAERNDEALIDVGAIAGDSEWFGHLQHQVGRAELPAFWESRSACLF